MSADNSKTKPVQNNDIVRMVDLKLLPVCKCGYIFKDGIKYHRRIIDITTKKEEMFNPVFSFEPNVCPNCKRVIRCIDYEQTMIEE